MLVICNKDILLLIILIIYFYPIYVIKCQFNNNDCISNIIKNKNIKNKIFISMLMMGIFVLLYEYLRYDKYSFILVLLLLINIYGLILFDEANFLHNIFAVITFIIILLFMFYHFINKKRILCLYSLFILQLLLFLFCCIIFYKKKFNYVIYFQVSLLLNFAVYYVLLHFL